MADDTKPGTPETPAPGDSQEPVQAETTQDGGEGAEEKPERTDWKALYLSSKDKVERANELEQENRRLREEGQRQAATDTRMPSTQEQADLQQIQADLAATRQLAQYDSPEGAQARLTLRGLEYTERQLLAVVANQQFDKVRDDEVRAEAEKFWRSGDYRTPQAAIKAARGELAEKREKQTGETEKDIAKREAALKAEREARENGKVDTVTRGVSVREAKDKMRPAEYVEKVQEATKRQDWNEVKRLNALERAGHVLPA